jgi:heme A synthase
MRSHSTKATVALVLSVVAVLVCPALYFAEQVALIGVATVSSEASNPASYTAIMIAILFALALLAFALPVTALLIAARARRDIRSSPDSLSGRPVSLAASIISTGVVVLLVLGQAFLALSAAGVCSLDGCF